MSRAPQPSPLSDDEGELVFLGPRRVEPLALARKIHRVIDEQTAEAMLNALRGRQLGAIAADVQLVYDAPAVRLRSGKDWEDIRTMRPLVVSLAAWVQTDKSGGVVIRYALDVREPVVREVLARVLRLRVPWVFHEAKTALFAFWALGLPVPGDLYDTRLAAACLSLGQIFRKRATDVTEQVEARDEAEAERERQLSLTSQGERYGVFHPSQKAQDAWRSDFAVLKDPAEPLSTRMGAIATTDAVMVLQVYLAQQFDLNTHGIANHLHTVEFPFLVANARMEWSGVHVAAEDRKKLRSGCQAVANVFTAKLRSLGMSSPTSRAEFGQHMRHLGLERHFPPPTPQGLLPTDDDTLEALEHLHPLIRAFRLRQKYMRLGREDWLVRDLVGVDGRFHPRHHQLGAATGRNTCTTPNLAGIGKDQRPIVTAPPGRAIVALDFAQMEIGIAAAIHHDAALIEAYNSGDVYMTAAKEVFRTQLPPEAQSLNATDFKREHGELRDRMKKCILGVIYNMQPRTLAAQLGISTEEAAELTKGFLNQYPDLKRGLTESSAYGELLGYAPIAPGLRRWVPSGEVSAHWKRNMLRNAPIQGGAAVAFKRAVIALDQHFAGTDTWLILPIHDAVVLECPADEVEEVAKVAKIVMEGAVRAMYPALRPRVTYDLSAPLCWHDGDPESLNKLLA